MSKSILLPITGNIYLMKFWRDHILKYSLEVDKVHVYMCNHLEDRVPYLESILDDPFFDFTYEYKSHQLSHGLCLDWLVQRCETKYFGLMEEDSFILKPQVLSDTFRKLETKEFDVVASTRVSCSEEVRQLLTLKFGRFENINLWPCFLFTHTELAAGLDESFAGRNDSDCGGWFSVRLREVIPDERIQLLPQGRGLFHRKQTDDWVHLGDVSGYSLWTSDGRSYMYQFKEHKVPYQPTLKPIKEATVAFHKFLLRNVNVEVPDDYRERYEDAVNTLQTTYGISDEDIENKITSIGERFS